MTDGAQVLSLWKNSGVTKNADLRRCRRFRSSGSRRKPVVKGAGKVSGLNSPRRKTQKGSARQ